MSIQLGVDAGLGAIKIYGDAGMLQFPSQVAVRLSPTLGAVHGLHTRNSPLAVTLANGGAFFAGSGAHDAGRPLENLERDRFTGSPEMRVLLYGALTRYVQQFGVFTAPIDLTLGLPLEALSGDQPQQTVNEIQSWIQGSHAWVADQKTYTAEIRKVFITLQPVGAVMDFFLDESGHPFSGRKNFQNQEVGVISIGFCTLELMVIQKREAVQKFTTSSTAGVRRLLEMINGPQLYSLGELDSRLRNGSLNVANELPIWGREVFGDIERCWGNAWKRFALLLVAGGGAILLQNQLLKTFGDRVVVMADPIFAISRGLYKLTLNSSRTKATK